MCKPLSKYNFDESAEDAENNTEEEGSRQSSHPTYPMIESELRALAKDCVDPPIYLYAHLIRNGYRPPETMRTFMASLSDTEWVDAYLKDPPPLRDLSMRVARSYLYTFGNIRIYSAIVFNS